MQSFDEYMRATIETHGQPYTDVVHTLALTSVLCQQVQSMSAPEDQRDIVLANLRGLFARMVTQIVSGMPEVRNNIRFKDMTAHAGELMEIIVRENVLIHMDQATTRQ